MPGGGEMASHTKAEAELAELLSAAEHYEKHTAPGHDCSGGNCFFIALAPILGFRSGTCEECGYEFWAEPRGRLPRRCPAHSDGYKRCSSCGKRCRPRQGNDRCAACLTDACGECGSAIRWPQKSFCSEECKLASRRRTLIQCKGCGVDIRDPAGAQSYCTVACRRRTYRRLKPDVANGPRKPRPWDEKRKASSKRRRAQIYTTQVDEIEPGKVFDRDGWTCYLCGEDVDRLLRYPDPMSASLDHVVALSRGGTHTWDNVACSHLRCNLQKGDRPLPEGAARCLHRSGSLQASS
ncbi:HNH endonuclease [Streptomyces sp. NPDC057424]|uniref:HNH endonuclease n=1 Tax=Streptomyces sp. NPDC057424 TaxID=3346127 RepID=UPI00368A9731